MNELKKKTIDGVFWGLIEKFGNQVIQFTVGIIIARLLLPEDYGLVGMIVIFTALSQALIEGGFTAALIRKKDVSSIDYSTVFWFNLSVAIVTYLILFFSAPFIADFYAEPKLVLTTRFIGINLIFTSLSIVQRIIILKQFKFEDQAKINLSSILVSGIVGIILAKLNFGIWALVFSNLTKNFLVAVLYWFKTAWVPSISFSKIEFRSLFKFSSRLMVSSIINNVSENIYSLVIGKLFNSKSLGYFSRAQQFQQLPVSGLYGAINAVCLPLFSEVQDDSAKLKNYYIKIIRLTTFLLFPIMGILATISDEAITIILTVKWLPSSPMLKLFCIIGAFYPLHAINLDILKVKGRSDLFLKLEIIKQLLNAVMIFCCFRYGIYGLIWGIVGFNFLCLYLNSYFSKMFIDYGFFAQLKDLSIFAVCTLLTMLFLNIIKYFLSDPVLILLTLPIVGFSTYIFTSKLFKVKELYSVLEIVSTLKAKIVLK